MSVCYQVIFCRTIFTKLYLNDYLTVPQLWEDAVYDGPKQPTNASLSPTLKPVTLQMWKTGARARVLNVIRSGYKVGSKCNETSEVHVKSDITHVYRGESM